MLTEIYEDILYIYYQGYIKVFPLSLQKQMISSSKIGKRIQGVIYFFSYIKKWFVGFTQGKNHVFKGRKIKEKVWFFADTQNQWSSLLPFFEKIKNASWVSQHQGFGTSNFVYLSGIHRMRFNFIFFRIYKYLKKSNQSKAKEYAEIIFEASGLYEYCLYFLKRYKPKKIILSSDHGLFTRSLIRAAEKYSIPTVYIQHASVSKYFPNLRATLNLLEGKHALDIYKKAGPVMGKVELIGMPKFDNFLVLRNHRAVVNVIGLALNPADDLKIIQDLVSFLAKKYPTINFISRKHPRDTRNLALVNSDNLSESNSQKESAFDFLKNIDLLIGGDSSIHLEATLLNIPCVYYCFTGHKDMKDFYGFIKNGMIQDTNTIEDVSVFIDKCRTKKEPVIQKTKYYNELVNTNMEGKSVALAIKYIHQL